MCEPRYATAVWVTLQRANECSAASRLPRVRSSFGRRARGLPLLDRRRGLPACAGRGSRLPESKPTLSNSRADGLWEMLAFCVEPRASSSLAVSPNAGVYSRADAVTPLACSLPAARESAYYAPQLRTLCARETRNIAEIIIQTSSADFCGTFFLSCLQWASICTG